MSQAAKAILNHPAMPTVPPSSRITDAHSLSRVPRSPKIFTPQLKKCLVCRNEIPIGRTKYCSELCAAEGIKLKFRNNNPQASAWEVASPSVVGAIGEMTVCSDLLLKGYEVFRSVAPTCSCDLIALKDSKSLRIEVKVGHRMASGGLKKLKTKPELHDILAIVEKTGPVHYFLPDHTPTTL